MQTKYKRKLIVNNTIESGSNSLITLVKKFKQSVKLVKTGFLNKYKLEGHTYNVKQINDIIYNEKANIVALFKDYLIFDDSSEFLKRFYKAKESTDRLPRLYDYYENYSKIFPNYIILSEAKYIYKNIQKKQRIIDNQQLNELRQGELKEHSLSNLFDTKIYKSILNQSENSLESYNNASNLKSSNYERIILSEDIDKDIDDINNLIDYIDKFELDFFEKKVNHQIQDKNPFKQSTDSFYSKKINSDKDLDIINSKKLINNYVVTSKAVTYTNKNNVKSIDKEIHRNYNNTKAKITPKNVRDCEYNTYSRPQSTTHSKYENCNKDISNKNKILNIVNSNLNKQKERKMSENYNIRSETRKPQPFIIEDNTDINPELKNNEKYVYIKQSPFQNSVTEDVKFNNTSNNVYYIINQNQNSNTHINIFSGDNTIIKTLKRTLDPNDNYKERNPLSGCEDINSSKLGKRTIDNHRRVYSDVSPIGKEILNDQFDERKRREDLKNMLKILESRKRSTGKNIHQRNSSLVPTSSLSNKTKSILNNDYVNRPDNSKNIISSSTGTYKLNINSSDFKPIEVNETPNHKKFPDNEINLTASKKGANINDLRKSINNVVSFHKKNFSYKFNVNQKNKTLETGKLYNSKNPNNNILTKENKIPTKSVVCTGSLNFDDGGASKPVYIRSMNANEVKSIHMKNNSLNTIDYTVSNTKQSYIKAVNSKKNN